MNLVRRKSRPFVVKLFGLQPLRLCKLWSEWERENLNNCHRCSLLLCSGSCGVWAAHLQIWRGRWHGGCVRGFSSAKRNWFKYTCSFAWIYNRWYCSWWVALGRRISIPNSLVPRLLVGREKKSLVSTVCTQALSHAHREPRYKATYQRKYQYLFLSILLLVNCLRWLMG